MSFRRAFPLSFCFSFLRLSGFHLRGKTGFSASLLHGKKLFFRLLVQVARKFCGHWKQKMSFLHGFLLTFGFSWQEFPFLELWCKRGGCCLFAGIFISFPDILSARKCWLVRLSVMPDFSFFWPDSGCMP